MNIKDVIKHPRLLLFSFGMHGWIRFFDDETYLRLMYRCRFGKKLDLEHPVCFSEKLQWLKLHDRKPEYTRMVDKCEAKTYVAEKLGEQYVIPTLGVWDSVDEIDFDALPERFVLKCTHDSHSVILCRDKQSFDREAAKKKLRRAMKRNYYYVGREWPYKNVKPRVLAEQFMEDRTDRELRDYKLFCFDGAVKALMIVSDRFDPSAPKNETFFDAELHPLFFSGEQTVDLDQLPHPPVCFEEMKRFAALLSQGIRQLRVDFYEINGRVFFGELTFYDGNGFLPDDPPGWDAHFGRWLNVP